MRTRSCRSGFATSPASVSSSRRSSRPRRVRCERSASIARSTRMHASTSSSEISAFATGTGSGDSIARIMSEAAGRDALAAARDERPMRPVRKGYTVGAPYRFERACRHGAYILQAATTLPQEVTMGRKLYVGNLPYSATEQSLREAFSASGTVDSVSVITDRDTGQSKGFAFVEMATDQEAQAATQAMNEIGRASCREGGKM